MANHDTVLVGKVVLAVFLAKDKKAIKFVTDHGDIVARTDGDCCSYTWVEHIELPALGFPAMVIEVSDLDMPDHGTPDGVECVTYYGFKIVTDRGDMVIDYRNESNGYYGGNLAWPGDYYYGGVFGQNVSKEEYEAVLADV